LTLVAGTFAVAISGCAPAAPALSDPREILAQAVDHLGTAKTFHVDASIDGALGLAALAPLMPGGGGLFGGAGTGSVALTGTHASGDLDLAGRRAAIQLEVPALLGLTAELREVDGTGYLTSSLTAAGWHRLDGPGAAALASLRPLDAVSVLEAWLARPGVVPTRLDDADCAAGRCYVIRITGSGADLVGAASGAGGSALGSRLVIEQVTADLRIARDTLRLSEIVLTIDLGAAGSVDATLRLTAWDSPVTIVAPAPNEIVAGPLLP
jgi:hypothetical protein